MLWQRLRKLGFDIDLEEIFTSLMAARDVVTKRQLTPYLMVDEAALPDFQTFFPTDTEPGDADSVLVGLAPDKFNYQQMNHAMNILLKNPQLIAIHKARYYKEPNGLSLGPGPFVTALEHSADCTATVVGKPEQSFFKAAIEPFGCLPGQVAMIGDVSFLFYLPLRNFEAAIS